MKINNVQINNWESPGDQWWKIVEQSPDKPLIEATIQMTLSWSEYQKLLSQDERSTSNNLDLIEVENSLEK